MSSQQKHRVLIKTLENLQTLIDQLKDEEVERAQHSYVKNEFWKNLNEASVVLSHEVTKVSLSFSKPPFPDLDLIQPLLTSLEMRCLCLTSVFYGFPKIEGLTVLKLLRSAIVAVIESIYGLISDISNIEKDRTKDVLISTSHIWERIEALKSLPTDNKEAVLKMIQSNNELINDALIELENDICIAAKKLSSICEKTEEGEIDESEDEDDDDDRTWSGSEVDICKVSLGLFKTAHACTRKISSSISASEMKNPNELDIVLTNIERISPSLDDLASTLYPPIKKNTVIETARLLAGNLNLLLSTVRDSQILSNKETWLEFLMKAIDHNLNKVENVITDDELDVK